MSISVVTIASDNPEEFRLTMRHVDMQSMPPFEHIVIDCSPGGRIKKLFETEPKPSYRRWICETCRGKSDAFNKGILNATGDIIHLHHAGDYYFDRNTLREVANTFWANPTTMWLHGRYAISHNGKQLIYGRPVESSRLYSSLAEGIYPTVFVHKELYEKHGLFRLDKKIAMEYDFVVRIAHEPAIFLPTPIVYAAPGKADSRTKRAARKEMLESYYDYNGFSLKAWLRSRMRLPAQIP